MTITAVIPGALRRPGGTVFAAPMNVVVSAVCDRLV
jgi:hypothetical protein